MFKWLKDRYNKFVNDRLIKLYPGMHYRQRKKNAVRLAYKTKLEEINSHIYSYHKELSRWDSFQIHLEQWLTNSRISLILEIKHLSKLRNLMLKFKRVVSRIKESVEVVVSVLETILVEEPERNNVNLWGRKVSIIYASFPLNTLEVIHRLDAFQDLFIQREKESKLPKVCSDCGNDFINRWRHPVFKDKHYVCVILGD